MADGGDKRRGREEDGLTDEERKTLEELEREAKALEDQGYSIDVTDEDDPVGRGVQIVGAMDEQKDTPGGLSDAIIKKYADQGRGLMRDNVSTHLDPSVRRQVAPILGGDPGDVRIHTGEKAQKAADALGARAFAMGSSDIYFGRGEYAPNTADGMGVLVHELTHTMDEDVGAALSAGDAAGSPAEAKAEAKESEAMQSVQGDGGTDSGGAPEQEPNPRMLAEEVVKVMATSRRRASKRTGGTT
jgi:hypothetical protein